MLHDRQVYITIDRQLLHIVTTQTYCLLIKSFISYLLAVGRILSFSVSLSSATVHSGSLGSSPSISQQADSVESDSGESTSASQKRRDTNGLNIVVVSNHYLRLIDCFVKKFYLKLQALIRQLREPRSKLESCKRFYNVWKVLYNGSR